MMPVRQRHITRARHARLRRNIIAMRPIDPHCNGRNGDIPPRRPTAYEARCLPNRPRGFGAAPSLTRAPKVGCELHHACCGMLKAPQFMIHARQCF